MTLERFLLEIISEAAYQDPHERSLQWHLWWGDLLDYLDRLTFEEAP